MTDVTPANPPGDPPLILIGAGGHARVLIDALSMMGRTIEKALDDDPDKQGQAIDGVPIVGGLDLLEQMDRAGVRLIMAIGSTRQPAGRAERYEQLSAAGFGFETIIHPAAVVSPSASLGNGAQIMAGAIVGPGARIEDNVLVNTRASVDHDCNIGPHTHLGPGATLSGGVQVGRASHIGCGATIIENIHIGCGVMVAAGAVVIAPVPDNTIVRGVPARPSEADRR